MRRKAQARNDEGKGAAHTSDLPDVSSATRKNISVFRKCNSVYIIVHPAAVRGALRDRHGRWQRDAMDALGRKTSDTDADGKTVWS
jgi:hypothetical protein